MQLQDKKTLNPTEFKYKIKTASEEEIFSHLLSCDEKFVSQLKERTELAKYSKKIFDKAVTFEAWCGNILVGLIAAYFNDTECNSGYISNVSVISDYLKKGIAAELMKLSLKYALENKYKEILLEVNESNHPAINLYRKFGFEIVNNLNSYATMKLTLQA